MLSKQLRHAAARHDLAQIKSILMSNNNIINAKSRNGRTALYSAVNARPADDKNSLDCVQYLLEQKADPNCSDTDGIRPIFLASDVGGDEECVRLLLHHKAVAANCCDCEGWTALHYAVSQDAPVTLVKLLLDAGVNVDEEESNQGFHNYHETTALGSCCYNHMKRPAPTSNAISVVHALLDAGANPRLVYRIPDAVKMILSARSAAKRGAIAMYAIVKQRLCRDMARLVAAAVWDTRQDEEWNKK